MSRRRQDKVDITGLAADRGPEDGADPKEFHQKPWDAPKKAGRKALQLCGQVRDVLHAALAGCGDGVLQAVAVVGVEPAPHTGRLRVTVAVPADGAVTRDEAAAHLGRAAGLLRSEVAGAIRRRKAPELVFAVA
jgi:ribosome-binding factor A